MKIGDRVRIDAPGTWAHSMTGVIVEPSATWQDWVIRTDGPAPDGRPFPAYGRELTVVDE